MVPCDARDYIVRRGPRRGAERGPEQGQHNVVLMQEPFQEAASSDNIGRCFAMLSPMSPSNITLAHAASRGK
eukprot:6286236-Heterocapsa_arctica.AAC.1